MSSFTRTLQRRALRKSPDYTPKPQLTQIHPDGSYHVLHPTRGWRFVCAARAQLYV
jgi:hypothetical protein